MNVIVCLEDNNGLLFNKRRLSSDKVVIDRVINIAGQSCLWVSEYSAELFKNKSDKLRVDNDFLNKISDGEYCFIEDIDISKCASKVEKVIIYWWNRRYPSDVKFPVYLFADKWKVISTVEFEGNSHLNIREEIYVL